MKPIGISLLAGGMIMLIIATFNLMSGGMVNPGTVEVLNVDFDPRTWTPYLGAAMVIAGLLVLVEARRDEKTIA